MKKYSKIVCEKDEFGGYFKRFYDEYGKLDKTEVYNDDKLLKVEYYLRQPPYDNIIAEHFRTYENVLLDLVLH